MTFNNNWDHIELPQAIFLDPNNPFAGTAIATAPQDRYRITVKVLEGGRVVAEESVNYPK